MTAAALFAATFGVEPEGVWSAPGRVNLIGEHTDYNDGLVLPFAIDSRASVAVSRSAEPRLELVSAQQGGQLIRRPLADLRPGASGGWSDYLAGVLWVLAERGVAVPGLRIALDSTVPAGAGLSSSAAIECATALAVSDLLGLDLDPARAARVAQQAENDFVGMPCGLMDQMAAAASTAGHVLFFDVRAGTVEQVPFDPAAEGLQVLIIDTRVKHALTDGEYAKRRASCEQAAAELGVSSLRELGLVDLPRLASTLSSDLLVHRARHVITENARVERTVQLLRRGQIGSIGPELVASHESLRVDYEVSDPALDLAVVAALKAGALGARMTGGGFGGSAIALVRSADADRVAAAVLAAFEADGRTRPVLRRALPSDGARRDR